jgi:very-short-patch-repair endonuclease
MLELGMELCGTYALREEDDDDGSKRDYCLIDAAACRRHVAAKLNINGITLARQVARFLASGSASPMETKMYLLMCLPQRYGGYNLPVPELNPNLSLSYKGQILLRQSSVYPDFLWRDAKLVLEYDGAYHDTPNQQQKDAMRKTVIEAEGYTVLQVKRWQLYNPLAFDAVMQTMTRIIGKRLRPLNLEQEHARDNLRRRLLAPDG